MGKAETLLALLAEGQSSKKVRQRFLVSEHKAPRQSLDSDGAQLWDSALNAVLLVLKPRQGPAASTHSHL